MFSFYLAQIYPSLFGTEVQSLCHKIFGIPFPVSSLCVVLAVSDNWEVWYPEQRKKTLRGLWVMKGLILSFAWNITQRLPPISARVVVVLLCAALSTAPEVKEVISFKRGLLRYIRALIQQEDDRCFFAAIPQRTANLPYEARSGCARPSIKLATKQIKTPNSVADARPRTPRKHTLCA